jgi:predicted nucleic-acid-binding protein
MLAVDTNIVVRYLTDDDPVQSARARQVLDGQAVFLATTVLLETTGFCDGFINTQRPIW